LIKTFTLRKILLITLLFVVQNTFAQVDSLSSSDSLSYERLAKFPLATVTYTSYSNSKINKDGIKRYVGMSEVNANLQFAIPLKNRRTILLNKFNFNQSDVLIDSDGEQSHVHNQYYSFAYSFGLIKILNKRWKIIGVLTPTLASDFDASIGKNDFILQSSILVSKRSSPYFEYGFGFAYNTRFGQEIAIPLISLTYKKGDWGVFAVLPAYISSYYHLNNSKIGLSLAAYGNVYNAEMNVPSSLDLDKLGYSRINFGPEYQVKMFNDVYLNLKAGITFRNRLEAINSDGDLELDLSAKTKYFFSVGIRILK